MKRSRKLLILLGILVVAVAVAVVISLVEEKKEKIKSEEAIVLELDPASATALSWEYDETSLAFHKDGEEASNTESSEDLDVTDASDEAESDEDSAETGTDADSDEATTETNDAEDVAKEETESTGNWLYDEDEAFPVDAEKINALLENFSEFSTAFTIEDVEDYSQYGLDDPECVINITNDGTDYEIKLGGYSTMDEQRYVSIGDGKVYLAASDPLETFQVSLEDMIKDDEIPEFDEVSDIVFEGKENYSVYSDESGTLSVCEEDIYFTDDSGETRPLDTSRVSTLLDNITYIDQSTYVTYNASEEEIAQYGMDNPEQTITITYVSEVIESDDEDSEDEKIGDTITINLSRSAELREKLEADAADSANADTSGTDSTTSQTGEENSNSSGTSEDEEEDYVAYVRINDSQIIYEISSSDFEELMAVSYNDLRHGSIFTADFEQVTEVNITLDGSEYKFTKAASEEDPAEDTFYYNDEEIDILDFENALEAVYADSFTDESPTEKEEISLTVKLDNENFKEISMAFYRYDGENCLAVVNGKTVGLVDRTYVVDLIEAVNAIVL